ncbi:MAG: DUF4439 domain-containing protein [Jatrophihabitans sp.]|uniref:DUF4439 domain-containing protein n=1 Tax=Jatrophihabitans sp. TaxID=1932789 RepID=UPI003915A192
MTALDTAWQAALAVEQQAAFGYALLGPHLSGTDKDLAVQCSDDHESRRDATAAAIAGAGLRPVAPQADYPALYPVAGPGAARALAVRLEEGCAVAWRYLYLNAASTAGQRADGLRQTAQEALTASAIRATRWRVLTTPAKATTPFPGIG